MEEDKKKYHISREDDLEGIYRELEKAKLDEMLRSGMKQELMTDEKKRVMVKERKGPHVTSLRMDEGDELEDLRLQVDEVMGSISERKRFLEKRMSELENAIENREKLHERILKEIEAEIKEKELLMKKMSDAEAIRDILLDISALKSQRRKEEVQFWRDMTQLRNELALIEEEHEITQKLSRIIEED